MYLQGGHMPLSERVNLRLSAETFEAYEKVASFFNISVTELVRQAVDASVPTMDALGEMIDRAKAGDADAARNVFGKLMDMHASQIALAQAMNTPASWSPQEGADRPSNTVR